MDQWNMCQFCLDFQTLFLYILLHREVKKCPNNVQLICIYKALISFSVISTNSMFLDWFCKWLVVTWQVIFWIYSIYLILYHMYHFATIIPPLRVLLQYKQREAERARLDASSHWDSSKRNVVGPQNAENKNKVTHQIQYIKLVDFPMPTGSTRAKL